MNNRQIRSHPGAATLFLIDECHKCDECTRESIASAGQLFDRGVVLAGVEGYEGGLRYDDYDDRYAQERVASDCSAETMIGDYPMFAQALLDAGYAVIGVDCRGLGSRIEADLYEGTWASDDAAGHPKQRERTDHFVRTLAEEATARELRGDLLLSCGAAHNDHIEEALQGMGSPPSGWPDWNYVRLRCKAFDACVECA